LRTPDGPRRVLRCGLTGLVDQQPAEGLPPQTGEHPAEGGKGGGDQGDDEEEQLPGRLSFRRLQPVRAAAGDDLQCRTQTVAHLPGGVGEEVLVQLQGSQEQLRSGSIYIGVASMSVQHTLSSATRMYRADSQ